MPQVKDTRTLHGGIALIKSGGVVIGLMRSIDVTESITRIRVGGVGTILPKEQAATQWDGTVTTDFMMINLKQTGIPGAIRRDFDSATSQVLNGNASFEDQLVLDDSGVQVDVFKKVKDVQMSDGKIIPKVAPIAVIKRCMIDSDAMNIAEGGVSSRRQSFKYLDPVLIKD